MLLDAPPLALLEITLGKGGMTATCAVENFTYMTLLAVTLNPGCSGLDGCGHTHSLSLLGNLGVQVPETEQAPTFPRSTLLSPPPGRLHTGLLRPTCPQKLPFPLPPDHQRLSNKRTVQVRGERSA